jgi:TolA-binding protein
MSALVLVAPMAATCACGSATESPPPSQAPSQGVGVVVAPESLHVALEEDELAVLDPRRSRMQPRSPSLVAVEAEQLEALLAATPATSPDQPALLRRLAEESVELENAAMANGRIAAVGPARRAAIEYYRRLVAFHGASRPPYALADEAQYYLAWEHVRSGDFQAARRAYLDLINGAPSSRWVPHAYFMFGALFAAEAAADPSKAPLAKAAFDKAASAPDLAVAALARKRLQKL